MTTQNDVARSPETESHTELIDTLLTELKDDQGGAKKTALRRALDVADGTDGETTDGETTDATDVAADTSIEVRIQHLQSTVETFAAYTDALEAFLDEEGTADDVLTDVQDGLDAANEEIEMLQTTSAMLEQATGRLEGRLDDLEVDVDSRIDNLDGRVTEFDAAAAERDDRLESLEDRILELEEDAETAREWRESLQSALQ